MKKLLAVAVLFTAFSFTSWDANAKKKEKSCMELAWDFGTDFDDYEGHNAYYWTNYYYTNFC